MSFGRRRYENCDGRPIRPVVKNATCRANARQLSLEEQVQIRKLTISNKKLETGT
jgi:hypothetical protein